MIPASLRQIYRSFRQQFWVLRHEYFDWRLNIKTFAQSTGDPKEYFSGNSAYEPISHRGLKIIIGRVPLSPEDVSFDLGCGMGLANCYFARERIRKSVGVEFDPALANRARINAAMLRGRVAPVEIITGDAACQEYAGATIVFMYNPFGVTVMRPVLKQLAKTFHDRPRRLRIVYANPVEEKLFDEFPQFKRLDLFSIPYQSGTMQVIIWQADPGAQHGAGAGFASVERDH